MAKNPIQIEYNQELKPLEDVLSEVRRPGEFYVSGVVEEPMPRVEIEGVGIVSFPVPETQIRDIIQHASLAPYGRGEQTIVDASVRKVWQVPPGKVRLGGNSWEKTFATILARVVEGLGCKEATVSAELYKLLVYDKGGFFVAHRDTEKTGGMFGTLVIVLPSSHRGGELVIRHAGRESTVDLSTQEISELSFVAFYADCEHEVRPITSGNRVCLIYNLIQQRAARSDQELLTAPNYKDQIAAAAAVIQEALHEPDAPVKIVYLLEHQYSPASLSFAALKNADAALGKVLVKAAQQAGCAVHLGIVHIEESGSAEMAYEPRYRRSRWRDDNDDNNVSSSAPFEVIEVCDSTRHIAEWVDLEDRAADFGQIPLGENELLPEGGLDDEKPDVQRVSEATGNEGASFERSYRRAAIVLWREDRYPEVLLQAGIGAVLPYLKKRVQEYVAAPKSMVRSGEARNEIVALTRRIIQAWQEQPYSSYRLIDAKQPSRVDMLKLLESIGDVSLLRQFIEGVITMQYDGSENKALVESTALLSALESGNVLSALISENMPTFHLACADLLQQFIRTQGHKPSKEALAASLKIARAAIDALPAIPDPADSATSIDWLRRKQVKPLNADLVTSLWNSLQTLDAESLLESATVTFVTHGKTFTPDTILIPALAALHREHGDSIISKSAFAHLWRHSAEFLLARNEFPPVKPSDWKQAVTIACKCEDCRVLQAFLLDPASQIHRFRMRQDRRYHVEGMIQRHSLDMTTKTETGSSPQTLVCTKNYRTYLGEREQHRKDLASLGVLVALVKKIRTLSPRSQE